MLIWRQVAQINLHLRHANSVEPQYSQHSPVAATTGSGGGSAAVTPCLTNGATWHGIMTSKKHSIRRPHKRFDALRRPGLASWMHSSHERVGQAFDFHAAVRRTLRDNGFDPDAPDDVVTQVAGITRPAADPRARDLRHRPWSSIDNVESRDLDQLEIAESLPDGSIRVIVAIADVDGLVPKGSPIDRRAYANATSVYAAGAVFPMLPEKLSTDLTSLAEGVDRLAVAIETVVTPRGRRRS